MKKCNCCRVDRENDLFDNNDTCNLCLEYQKEYRKNNKRHSYTVRRDYRNRFPEKEMFNSAKWYSKINQIEFNITQDYVKSLLPAEMICPIANIQMSSGTYKDKSYSPTLNRIDQNKGYTKGNLQVICCKAADIKGRSTLSELERFYNYKLPEQHNINDPKMSEIVIHRKSFINEDYNEDTIFNIMNVEACLYKRAKNRSRESGLPFDLDIDYVKSIFPLDNCCPIFGNKFDYTKDFSAALNKIMPEKGYVKGNIVVLSRKAADIKNNFSIQEFLDIVSSFRKYYNKTGTGIIL